MLGDSGKHKSHSWFQIGRIHILKNNYVTRNGLQVQYNVHQVLMSLFTEICNLKIHMEREIDINSQTYLKLKKKKRTTPGGQISDLKLYHMAIITNTAWADTKPYT